jgi:hypothetical protein
VRYAAGVVFTTFVVVVAIERFGGIDPLAIRSSRPVLAQHDALAVGRQLQVQISAVWELHDHRIGCAPHLAAAEVAQ